MTQEINQVDVVDELSALCRGEISAVETYNQALQASALTSYRAELTDCQRSHQARVFELTRRIQALGGWAPDSSGAWGAFAKAVEGTATAIGEKTAIAALEEGEDHGLKEYRTRSQRVDSESRSLIQERLLPAQEATHGVLRRLKKQINGESN